MICSMRASVGWSEGSLTAEYGLRAEEQSDPIWERVKSPSCKENKIQPQEADMTS